MSRFPDEILPQTISWLGALAILGAYAASRFWTLNPSGKTHAALNAVGGFLVAGVAVYQRQQSIVVLEGTWGAISVMAWFKPHRGPRE